MDYDATDIPDGYDRGRDHGPELLQLWMDVVASSVGKQRLGTILDLGCGTGRFSEALAAHFDAEVAGIDPSNKMLEHAQRKQRDRRVRYQLGRGEAIPLPNNAVDLVFMSMTFHHFDDPLRVAQECYRVLREGGTALLRTGTRERIPDYPYVPFFPKSVPIMKNLLPTIAMVRVVFAAAGFSTVSDDVVMQQIAPNYEVYAAKLAAGADSVLARLSPHGFQAGVDAVRAHAARVGETPVTEPIDVFVFRS
jgi:ubiquinone/menaquinone biosynthesis C-methylase UbiE